MVSFQVSKVALVVSNAFAVAVTVKFVLASFLRALFISGGSLSPSTKQAAMPSLKISV